MQRSVEGTSSNRDAVGAVVTVSNGRRRWTAVRYGGGSYQSASDPRLHFGLGSEPETDPATVEVRWPAGRVDRYPKLRTNTGYHVREGDKEARPLTGYRPASARK
jgi:hypothetical protein